MKKLFTLFAAVLLGSVVSFAQTDNSFQFVDAEGNVVADGTTWHVYDTEEDSQFGTIIPSGLSVKNTVDSTSFCAVDYQVTQISGGAFQICFPINCTAHDKITDLISTDPGPMLAGLVKDIETEWVIRPKSSQTTVTGTCTATIQLKTYREIQTGEIMGFPIYDYELIGMGPKITIVFHNDGTADGIDGVATENGAKVEAYYNLGGVRLGAPQKGLNIVKYTDGTTKKIVVK